MRQSKQSKKENTAALYLRLSRDDNMEGESYSITNQRKLLTKVSREKGYSNLEVYIDDGISGVTMNRPEYVRMLRDIENGKISAVFVKDLSRLGRNYIEVGRLTEEFFPEHDIRLVAVSDNIDSYEGESEFAPIKNLFNEWYSRDISKKRRISNKIKGNSGEPLSRPPYGYIKNPDNPKRWIIDDEASKVVRRIYELNLSGYGTHQIAEILERDKVLTPISYWNSKGEKRPGNRNTDNPYGWASSTVVKILSLQEYCGDIINFKTFSKSYKNKKRYKNSEENIVVFKDVNPPIIERSVWESIQLKRGKVRKRKKADGERNMFSGLLVCADCGSNLNYHFNQKNHSITYFNCTGYNRGGRKICSSSHYIRTDFLEKVVFGEIKRLTAFALKYEDEFVKLLSRSSDFAFSEKLKDMNKQLIKLKARDNELDMLFEKTYEDNVSGKLSDERFYMLSQKYDTEQSELKEEIKKLQHEINKAEERSVSTDIFLETVRKFSRIKKLTPQVLNAFIEKIEVSQAEKIEDKTIQSIKIYYNCVGTFVIPELVNLPENNVVINTRQGVDVCYKRE